MLQPVHTIDRRTALLIGGAALAGAGWAALNLRWAGGNGAGGASSYLVWTVFAVPFFSFWGWVAARRDEAWLAAFVCFCIYFFGVFVGARLELLIEGQELAAAHEHALYFRLTLAGQLIACLVAAAQRAYTRGTIQVSTEA